MTDLPKTQYAVQLVGPDELFFNDSKEIVEPGPHQIVGQVEAVGLCFSDLKLLKQFSGHVRKADIISGIERAVLEEISSYKPDEEPTVPGHESVVRIAAVGPGVEDFKVGERYLVQTDYRWLPTPNSNASFGYNFEGGLQEYVLMDERVITSPEGESLLIPVSNELSASAVGLVEPWACVEDSYACKERRTLKEGGRMLVAADSEIADGVLADLIEKFGKPGNITWISDQAIPDSLEAEKVETIGKLEDATFDDVIYFGCDAVACEKLFPKVGPGGLFNLVQCGGKFGKNVVTQVGRVHYGGIRLIGTTGSDPAEAMEHIPVSGEIRAGDKINNIGAGGPMGVMHVIRNLCQGVEGVSIFAGDMDDERLAELTKNAEPLAEKNGLAYKTYNPTRDKIDEKFDYIILMVPVPKLVAEAVEGAAENAIVNIFAGIPATVSGEIDLDAYIEKHLYFIGSSGSVLDDMKEVLSKVESGKLDTDVSVAAVCDLENAAEGIRAVENRLIAGKIVVYPATRGLGLVSLKELGEKIPEVAAELKNGLWTKQAEEKLLQLYKGDMT